MKNQITSKILKFAFAFMFVLLASSCSEDNETLDAAALAKENIGSELLARTVTVDNGTFDFPDVICVNEEFQFCLNFPQATAGPNAKTTNVHVQLLVSGDDPDTIKIESEYYIQIAKANENIQYCFNYKFTATGDYQLRFKIGADGSDTWTDVTINVGDCSIVEVEEGCSMSQGFWFAKPESNWSTVTVGDKDYSKAEGLAIWNSINKKGGIADSKKGFLQVAAIKLSGSTVLSTDSVWADVKIVEDWLKTLDKLTPSNLKDFSNSNAAQAAGRIGDWINTHHCTEE